MGWPEQVFGMLIGIYICHYIVVRVTHKSAHEERGIFLEQIR